MLNNVFFAEFNCQCRYFRRCGTDIFAALFGKYVGLWLTVKTLLPLHGFRSQVVIAKLDFTSVNLGRMPTAQEIREFNQDIRECMRRAARERGIGSKRYRFLWCDEFGGWNPRTESHNTNLHAHGVYVGPYILQELLAEVWTEIRPKKMVPKSFGSQNKILITHLLIFSNASAVVLSVLSVTRLRCQSQCGQCESRCELVNGHEGDHYSSFHGHENRCR